MPRGSSAPPPPPPPPEALVVVGLGVDVFLVVVGFSVGVGSGSGSGSGSLVGSGVGSLATFLMGVKELEWEEGEADDVGGGAEWTVEEEEEDTNVVVGSALLVRTLQRLVSARLRMRFGSARASGAALGMAARAARAWWFGPRATWGLASAERAAERTTRVLETSIMMEMREREGE